MMIKNQVQATWPEVFRPTIWPQRPSLICLYRPLVRPCLLTLSLLGSRASSCPGLSPPLPVQIQTILSKPRWSNQVGNWKEEVIKPFQYESHFY